MAARPTFHPALGEYFVSLRTQRGWGQRQAAGIARQRKIAHLPHNTIYRLEHGLVKNPSTEDLAAMAELYGVPLVDVVARCVQAQHSVPLAPSADAHDPTCHDGEENRNVTARGGPDGSIAARLLADQIARDERLGHEIHAIADRLFALATALEEKTGAVGLTGARRRGRPRKAG